MRLSTIARGCAFADVSAKQYQDEMVLGSFIRGIDDTFIRQRLLETKTLTLEDAVNNATILRRAYDNARGFESGQETTKSIAVVDVEPQKEVNDLEHCAVTTKGKTIIDKSSVKECGNCGYKHEYGRCAAYGQNCYNCNRKGHFSKQ